MNIVRHNAFDIKNDIKIFTTKMCVPFSNMCRILQHRNDNKLMYIQSQFVSHINFIP